MKSTSFVLIAGLLAGCATQSGVVPIGQDTYMVSRQGYTVVTSAAAIKADAFREANAYCQQHGKQFQVVRTSTLEGIPARRLPTAEIEFMCLDKGDKELRRPKLESGPDVIIENRER